MSTWTPTDPIDAALQRERPAKAAGGWPTHKHRARTRRRNRATLRRRTPKTNH